MPWFKVDDKLHSHKKVAKAGDAMALWVVAGSWCSDQLTDGFVPDYMAGRLVPGGDKMAERLVEAGLWVEGEHDGDDGWWFHDWADKNPTADEVEAKREAAKERMRRVRANRKDNDPPSSDEVRANNAAGSPSPVPEPEPTPEPTTQSQPQGASADADDAPDDQAKVDDAFEQFWQAYPPTNGVMRDKKGARKQWDKLSWDERRDAYRGAKNKAAHFEATGEEPPYALRFLRRRDFLDYQQPVTVDKATGQVRTIDTTPTCVHCQQAVDAHDDGMCDNGRAEAA